LVVQGTIPSATLLDCSIPQPHDPATPALHPPRNMPPPTREDLWSSGKDETVEVNQRALIDSECPKLLRIMCLCMRRLAWAEVVACQIASIANCRDQRSSRGIPVNIQVSTAHRQGTTSADSSVFRELLQNADDAGVSASPIPRAGRPADRSRSRPNMSRSSSTPRPASTHMSVQERPRLSQT
jgi:hypothetical protein